MISIGRWKFVALHAHVSVIDIRGFVFQDFGAVLARDVLFGGVLSVHVCDTVGLDGRLVSAQFTPPGRDVATPT